MGTAQGQARAGRPIALAQGFVLAAVLLALVACTNGTTASPSTAQGEGAGVSTEEHVAKEDAALSGRTNALPQPVDCVDAYGNVTARAIDTLDTAERPLVDLLYDAGYRFYDGFPSWMNGKGTFAIYDSSFTALDDPETYAYLQKRIMQTGAYEPIIAIIEVSSHDYPDLQSAYQGLVEDVMDCTEVRRTEKGAIQCIAYGSSGKKYLVEVRKDIEGNPSCAIVNDEAVKADALDSAVGTIYPEIEIPPEEWLEDW